jgi:hypothetical protein
MTEKLLQFIWQFQYLNKQNLCTTEGEPVTIIHPGQINNHQGPDFFNGRIRISETEWAGHIELHLKSSDWYKHRHETDPGYGKVILHVVWKHDTEVTDENNQPIPVLELQNRVSNMLLDQYEAWMNTPKQIPCGDAIKTISDLTWKNWLDRLLAERLLEKCSRVSLHIEQTESHWEEVCWRLVCTYFGGPVNKISFQQIAESLPLRILSRHKTVITQLEALLLGQAGLLHKGFTESYPQMLYREYQFLQKKYGLQVVNKPPVFLRMRPVDFPTVRLAQLAMLLHSGSHIFSKTIELQSVKEVSNLFDVTANDYWHYHYKLDSATDYFPKRTGNNLINRVIINAVIPVLFSYGHKQIDEKVREKALQWLNDIPAETNKHTNIFKSMERSPVNAGESQATLTLKQEYCDAKRCLECAVGIQILKKNT